MLKNLDFFGKLPRGGIRGAWCVVRLLPLVSRREKIVWSGAHAPRIRYAP
jgi:hypothetical protein